MSSQLHLGLFPPGSVLNVVVVFKFHHMSVMELMDSLLVVAEV
jgi:hypothetical protein